MKRAFYYHYNKPASQKVGRPQASIHFKGKCIIVDMVHCNEICRSRVRKTQPKWVMFGMCDEVIVVKKNGIRTEVINSFV